MAKQTGLGDRLMVNGYDLSGDVGAIQKLSRKLGEFNATGINQSAMERLQLLADGELQFSSYFTGSTSDTDSVHAHARLSNLATTAQVTYFRGTTVGAAGAGLVCKQFGYDLNRAANGGLLGAVSCKASGGVATEWGFALDVDAFADTQAGEQQTDELDLGASHGIDDMAFYLHVTDFDGTTATILIQEDDNADFTSATTYGTFTAVSASHAYQRLAVAGAPERYIRWSVSGTFTDITFSILAVPLYD